MSARRQGGGPGAAALLDALAKAAERTWWLLHGEDSFLVERALATVRSQCPGASGPGAIRTIWTEDGTKRLAAALDDVTTPLLFGGSALLAVRHVEHLDEQGHELLLGALPRTTGGARIVLVGGAIDMRRRLFAACQRDGGAFGFSSLADRREGREWVTRLAREHGREIAPAAIEELLERVGLDVGALAAEIEKLSLMTAASTRIDSDAVRATVAATRDQAVEELSDRIAQHDAAGAVARLRHLIDAGEPPPRILAFVAANLRRALHVAELREAGCAPTEISRRLGMPAWLVDRYVGRGSARDLGRGLAALRDADRALKSSRAAEAVFEAAILEIAGG